MAIYTKRIGVYQDLFDTPLFLKILANIREARNVIGNRTPPLRSSPSEKGTLCRARTISLLTTVVQRGLFPFDKGKYPKGEGLDLVELNSYKILQTNFSHNS